MKGNRRNRIGSRFGRNARSRMAARSGNRTRATGHGLTRRRFLGAAAAGVGAAVAGLGGVAHAARGATINVPEDYPTIQEAIIAAYDGDVIEIAGGEYATEDYPDVPVIIINKGLTLKAANSHDKPRIFHDLRYPVVIVDAPRQSVELRDLIVEGEHSVVDSWDFGQAVVHNEGSSSFVVDGCDIKGAQKGHVIALRISGEYVTGDVTVKDTTLEASRGSIHLGWFGASSVTNVENIEIIGCTMSHHGGFVYDYPIQQGTWGVVLTDYPSVNPRTKSTVIRDNTITAAAPIYTALDGHQQITNNTLNSKGIIFYAGHHLNVAINVANYGGRGSADISDNDIYLWVPTPPTPGVPEYSSIFMFGTQGLGLSNATVTDNRVHVEEDSQPVQYGISTDWFFPPAVYENVTISDNDLSQVTCSVGELNMNEYCSNWLVEDTLFCTVW